MSERVAPGMIFISYPTAMISYVILWVGEEGLIAVRHNGQVFSWSRNDHCKLMKTIPDWCLLSTWTANFTRVDV